MDTSVLKINNLCKSYKKGVPVIDNFSCELAGGKIIGLLGPNGCGKSTLMKLICGLLSPDSGEIYVCGEKRSENSNSFISYLPERTYFEGHMRVEELINYFEEFYSDFDTQAAYAMLSDLLIDPRSRLKALSKGTKEKVQLIMVMARRARLYLLDEPIAGVDPAAREYILNTIVKNYRPEATILITTHLITDIEPILNEFAFMSYGGQIVMSGDAEQAREKHGKSLDELFREVFRCCAGY